MAGPLDAVVEAAIRAAGRAAKLIDLREHSGEHPRVGATDVVPFVPLDDGESLEDCAEQHTKPEQKSWRRFGIPSYFYESSRPKARAHPTGKDPPKRLRRIASRHRRHPPADPTAGACMIGARRILIAYNVDLETRDPHIAQQVAKKGPRIFRRLPHVKAMGLYLKSRDCAQVSMNLTHFENIPLMDLLRTIDEEAAHLGTQTRGGELIGMIPRKGLSASPAFFQRAANFEEGRIIEERIAQLLR